MVLPVRFGLNVDPNTGGCPSPSGSPPSPMPLASS
jgi:hypothetical protein